MEQKTKIIIVGLIAVVMAFLGLFLWSYNNSLNLQRDMKGLESERNTLKSSFERSKEEISGLESQKESLKQEISRINQAKLDVERKYELANKAKEELIEKLKAKESEAAKAVYEQPQIPQTNDEYWAGVVKAKTDLEFQLSGIRVELKSLQISNEQLQREKSSLELDLTGLKRERDDFKRQLEYNKKIMDSIAEELVREKNDKTQIQESYKIVKNENMVLARQLKSLNNRKVSLERKLQDLQESKGTVERRFTEMETMLTQKITQIGDLKQELDMIKSGAAPAPAAKEEEKKDSVELPPIVVRPPQAGATQDNLDPSVSARVVAVNRDNNFVIIDQGADSGVEDGALLQVYRGSKPIASVEVIQVRKDISACDIKKETDTVKIGDEVR